MSPCFLSWKGCWEGFDEEDMHPEETVGGKKRHGSRVVGATTGDGSGKDARQYAAATHFLWEVRPVTYDLSPTEPKRAHGVSGNVS